jgi:hypothetical protein
MPELLSSATHRLVQGLFSSSAMPTLPRQGPSDESSQEFRDGSQKFGSSSCGVEMLAGGEARLPYLHGKPCRTGVFRSRPASRRSRARERREPLPDGAGPVPWRQAGGDTGHHRSPTRVRPSPRRRRGALVLMMLWMWPICRTIAGSTRFFARTKRAVRRRRRELHHVHRRPVTPCSA